MLRSDNGPCYSLREFHKFPKFLFRWTTSPAAPTLSTKQWIRRSFGGHRQEADGQISERRETVELWSSTVSDHSNLVYASVSIRDVDRRKPRLNLPQVPSSIGHNMDTSRIRKGIAEKTTNYVYFHRSHRIGTWTTSVCQGSAWKRLENGNHRSTSCRTRFLLGQVSRQLHLEKDQVNDQTKVSTFSS